MTINERLKEVRKTLKMNQTDFGKTVGVGQVAIYHYEAGDRKIPDVFINSVCLTHNVSEDWLRNGEGDMIAHNDDISDAAAAAAWMLSADAPDLIRITVEELRNLAETSPEAFKAFESFLRAIVSRLPPEEK